MKFSQIISSIAAVLVIIMGTYPALAQTEEYTIDGMTFGMPEAEVFTEDYDGPPVVGEHFTMLPDLAPLNYEGNKHHEVRLDAMVQEIEVAPGVRYTGKFISANGDVSGIADSICQTSALIQLRLRLI